MGYEKHHRMPCKKNVKSFYQDNIFICSQLNNSWKLVLRQAKTFFGDHKHSLTLLLKCEITSLGLH